jgi:hypothetical protein
MSEQEILVWYGSHDDVYVPTPGKTIHFTRHLYVIASRHGIANFTVSVFPRSKRVFHKSDTTFFFKSFNQTGQIEEAKKSPIYKAQRVHLSKRGQEMPLQPLGINASSMSYLHDAIAADASAAAMFRLIVTGEREGESFASIITRAQAESAVTRARSDELWAMF